MLRAAHSLSAGGIVGVLACAWAWADAGTAVQLRYTIGEGASGCPAEAAIREAVSVRLGYVPWREPAPRTVIVAVARSGRGLRARVELRDQAGDIVGLRELQTDSLDCRHLAAAVELAISIAIDPLSFARLPDRPPPRPAPARDGEPIPEQLAPAPAAGPASGTTARTVRLSASAGGLVAIGSAPSVAGGIALAGRLRFDCRPSPAAERCIPFSVGLEGRFDLPSYLEVPGGQVSTSLLLGSVQGCVHYKLGRGESERRPRDSSLLGCALFAAGGMRAAGHEIRKAQTETVPYLGAGLRLGVEVPLHRVLALRVHGDLLAALSRITLRATDTGEEIWSTPPLSGAFGLALCGHLR